MMNALKYVVDKCHLTEFSKKETQLNLLLLAERSNIVRLFYNDA